MITKFITRMHSSRMRTGRSLTVYRSLLPWGWGCLLPGGLCFQGVSAPGGGVCSWGGLCLWGVSASRGCVCSRGGLLWGGVCSWGVVCSRGCLLQGGVCSGGCLFLGLGVVSQHALRQTPPPVNRMTNRCKNITLATTSLRPVIKIQQKIPLTTPAVLVLKILISNKKVEKRAELINKNRKINIERYLDVF